VTTSRPAETALEPAAIRVLPYGRQALLVELADAAAVTRFHRALKLRRPAGVVELVPAARTVLVRFDRTLIASDALHYLLLAVGADDRTAPDDVPTASASDPAAPIEIPVRYDGADLAAVADEAGMSVEQVIARHLHPLYTCAFCGFAPGFSYLIGMDPALHVARLDQPRTRVPAGSVAIAGQFTAVYPGASPGGWRLLGATDAPMWDADRTRPALVPPGTRVRFMPARPRSAGGAGSAVGGR